MASYGIIIINSDAKVNSYYQVYVMDGVKNNVTLYLNNIDDSGLTYMIIRKDSSENANTCTITAYQDNTIDMKDLITLDNGQSVRIIALDKEKDKDWFICGRN